MKKRKSHRANFFFCLSILFLCAEMKSSTFIFADEATNGFIRDKYTLGKELGSGTFSIVRLATEKATGRKLAVKIIDKSNIDVSKESLKVEVTVMKKLDHPHAVKLVDLYESPRRVYLVLPLLEGGELFERLVNDHPDGYSEADASRIIRTILEAVAYMHSNGIAHRDLKPENILYATKAHDSPLMITDFGLAKITTPEVMMKTACGTPTYVAPEVLLAEEDGTTYGLQADMWSVGVIAYVLLCGYPPFFSPTDDPDELFDHIIDGEFDFPQDPWASISFYAKDFIRNLLTKDPRARLEAKKALDHPWLRNVKAF
eukprot:TRINITY_DN1559_c0_g1_i3.p1 TRINITY_DN1559_c0_g1~~TRINITY_DN1559_c0_g1_i3.p1  ORF type:complete len:315 (+),score=82.25 TRINITY_DN1559_c0_g1_i3:145-1089(+)